MSCLDEVKRVIDERIENYRECTSDTNSDVLDVALCKSFITLLEDLKDDLGID